MEFSVDMSIVEFDSFETAFPVPPGKQDAAARRFMTLFVEEGQQVHAGGTSYVCRARSISGEVFALKRLLAGAGIPKGAVLSPEDTARITQGHAAAFYEEYRNQMLVSQMRGFPKLYGYGSIDGEPAIVMEWVEGVSVRDIARDFAERGEQPPAQLVADLGLSVLEVLETLGRLDATLVHRDLSPANIMVRTDQVPLEEQMESGEYDICLIDFGSAAAETHAGDSSFTMMAQVWRHGTPEYAPPEMLAQDIPHADELRKSQTIDVFALSSVLYELYSGHTPWRVADHPEVSAYRLKMENDAELLEPREEADAPLIAAIMDGLSVDQAGRPSVKELLERLQAFQEAAGRGDVEAEGTQGAFARKPRRLRRGQPDPDAPPGLYTPDSTHFRAALAAEGGGRASDNIPAFSEPSGLSRRTLIIGGAAIAAVAVLGGAFAARSCAPSTKHLIDGSLVASEIYTGAPLYPARDDLSNNWMLIGGSFAIDLETDGHEPGRYVDGLIRCYNKSTGGYGFRTPILEGTAVSGTAWAIGRTFADAGDFSQAAPADGSDSGFPRLAAVKDPESGLWGYVGTDGEYAISPAYSGAARFSNGYAPVQFGDAHGLWGFVDAAGNKVLGPVFASLGICSDEGLAAALEDSSGLWGFADTDGEWAILPTYRHVRRFTEGFAGFYDVDRELWGFMDAAGKTVIEPTFLDVLPFSRGVAPAQDAKTRLWGLIDTAGKWTAGPHWLAMGERSGDLFPAHGSPANVYDIEGADAAAWEEYVNTGGDQRFEYGYIDDAGTWVHKPQYSDTLIRNPEQ